MNSSDTRILEHPEGDFCTRKGCGQEAAGAVPRPSFLVVIVFIFLFLNIILLLFLEERMEATVTKERAELNKWEGRRK